jgi:hypothetical protein
MGATCAWLVMSASSPGWMPGPAAAAQEVETDAVHSHDQHVA